MNTRICSKCREEKPLEEFHKNKGKPLGRACYCKTCSGKIDRERGRIRDQTPERIKKAKEWLHSERGKVLCALSKRKSYLLHREKYRARRLIEKLVNMGVIKRQLCSKCGDVSSLGHHPDYSKPLEVIWLCQKHHAEVHRIE